jgi:hypothetical protein
MGVTAQSAAPDNNMGRHKLEGIVGANKSGKHDRICRTQLHACKIGHSLFVQVYLRMTLVICLAQRDIAERFGTKL